VAILTCLFVGYVIKTVFVEEEISQSSQFKTRRIYRVMIRCVCPILLAVILVAGLYGIITG
jgi:NSS family neurotransmitter:Na+ symporter